MLDRHLVVGSVYWAQVVLLLGLTQPGRTLASPRSPLAAGADLVGRWAPRAGAVLAGGLVLVVLLALLWHWLVRHEQTVRRWRAGFLGHPRVAGLSGRFEQQIAFLKARLTPGGYLGLHLTVGAAVLIAAAWAFAAIAEDVVTGDPLTVLDQQVDLWLHHHTAPPLTTAMFAVSALGSVPMVGGLVAVVGAVLLWRRSWHRLLALLLTVPLGALLNVVLKMIFHRHRPVFAHPLLHLSSYSFPSGHSDASMLLYGVLTVFLVQWLQGWRWRTLVVLAAFLLILVIGFSRMYLGVHYLSDVLAGYAEGLAWLTICLTGVETMRHNRRRETG